MSDRMTTLHCSNPKCGKEITVKVADVKRGWGRFCSKSCKASTQAKTQRQSAGKVRAGLTPARRKRQDSDDWHEAAMDDATTGWGEGGWLD